MDAVDTIDNGDIEWVEASLPVLVDGIPAQVDDRIDAAARRCQLLTDAAEIGIEQFLPGRRTLSQQVVHARNTESRHVVFGA